MAAGTSTGPTVGSQSVGSMATTPTKMRGPAAAGPLIWLRLRGTGLVLGEHLAGLGANLRRDHPGRVLGLSRAGVLLAEPVAKDLRVDAQLSGQLLRSHGLGRGCHVFHLLRACGVVIHIHSLHHVVAAVNRVHSNLQTLYKPQLALDRGFQASRPGGRTSTGLSVGSKPEGHSATAPTPNPREAGMERVGSRSVVGHKQERCKAMEHGADAVGRCGDRIAHGVGDQHGYGDEYERVDHVALSSCCRVCRTRYVYDTHDASALRVALRKRLTRSVARFRVKRPRRVFHVHRARVMLAKPSAQRLGRDVQLASQLGRCHHLCHVVTPFRVFVVHDVIIAHNARPLCNDCVNQTHACQSFTTEIIACVNRSRRQSLNVSIIHTFNEPPLPAREGGITKVLHTRGAKREGDLTVAARQTTYEERYAA